MSKERQRTFDGGCRVYRLDVEGEVVPGTLSIESDEEISIEGGISEDGEYIVFPAQANAKFTAHFEIEKEEENDEKTTD